jgi:hypothetical protein
MIALFFILTLLLPPAPTPQPSGLPGVDGPGSIRIVWDQTSAANFVSAVRVSPDGIRHVIFISEIPDNRTHPWMPLPTWQGRAWRLYAPTWDSADRLEIVEQQRVKSVVRWEETHGPFAVQWRALLPLIEKAP